MKLNRDRDGEVDGKIKFKRRFHTSIAIDCMR